MFHYIGFRVLINNFGIFLRYFGSLKKIPLNQYNHSVINTQGLSHIYFTKFLLKNENGLLKQEEKKNILIRFNYWALFSFY